MLQRIEYLALLSVSRGCGFAAIAILTFFVGMSGNMPVAMTTAGILALITCLVLILKGQLALKRPYKRTELWVMLRPDERPDASIAQQIIGTVLREAYLSFALYAASFAAMALAGGLILAVVR